MSIPVTRIRELIMQYLLRKNLAKYLAKFLRNNYSQFAGVRTYFFT